MCLFTAFSSKTIYCCFHFRKGELAENSNLGRFSLQGDLVTIKLHTRVTKIAANLNVNEFKISQGFFPKLYLFMFYDAKHTP